jgi:hypothetical protein
VLADGVRSSCVDRIEQTGRGRKQHQPIGVHMLRIGAAAGEAGEIIDKAARRYVEQAHALAGRRPERLAGFYQASPNPDLDCVIAGSKPAPLPAQELQQPALEFTPERRVWRWEHLRGQHLQINL